MPCRSSSAQTVPFPRTLREDMFKERSPSPFCDGRIPMNLRRLIFFGLGILALAAPRVWAAEPYLEFVEGLRRNNYHDYALIYLDKLEKRADVPADVKEVIPFEKGITLKEGAKSLLSPEAQTRQYDQARVYFEQFLKASPKHAYAGRANTELAEVLVSKGMVEVMQSKVAGECRAERGLSEESPGLLRRGPQGLSGGPRSVSRGLRQTLDKATSTRRSKRRSMPPVRTLIGI